MSLLNMAEAAELGGERSIEIAVGSATLADLDRERIRALLSKLGRVEAVPQGADLVLKGSIGA